MNGQNDKFEYTYSAVTEEERMEIDGIRKGYVPQEKKESKLDRLRALDKKVKNPPTAFAVSWGVIGILVAGLGMTMVLEWEMMIWGIVVGVLGVALAALAYPIYKRWLNRNKRRYGEEILALSDELLHHDGK